MKNVWEDVQNVSRRENVRWTAGKARWSDSNDKERDGDSSATIMVPNVLAAGQHATRKSKGWLHKHADWSISIHVTESRVSDWPPDTSQSSDDCKPHQDCRSENRGGGMKSQTAQDVARVIRSHPPSSPQRERTRAGWRREREQWRDRPRRRSRTAPRNHGVQ